MTDIDLLYYELKKTKIKFNVARVVTLVLVFVPFIIGYINRDIMWLWISVLILILMIALVGIPILKNISKLKKELKEAEEALNHVKDY